MPTPWESELDQVVDQLAEEMIALRRHLHAHPEPSGQEHATACHLRELLERRGFAVRLVADECGLIVEGPADPATRCIALRADLDALWIHDRKTTPYRSQRDGVMHACGHDAHSAILVGALSALKTLAEAGRLPCPLHVRGIFQPSEETSGGALAMIEACALDGVDTILAVHVDPTREVGRVGIRSGPLTANCDDLDITIVGRGGHAARPHETIDPIAAAAQLISALYLFVPRATDSQDAVVASIGQIVGGTNPNVIPEQVMLRGTLRTLDGKVRDRTVDHIRKLARGLAETSGAKIEVAVHASAKAVRNDPAMTRLVERAARDLLGDDHIDEIARPSMGSEDFAFFLDHVPGMLLRLGSNSPGATPTLLHTDAFDVDERALAIGAKILARAVVTWCGETSTARKGGSP